MLRQVFLLLTLKEATLSLFRLRMMGFQGL